MKKHSQVELLGKRFFEPANGSWTHDLQDTNWTLQPLTYGRLMVSEIINWVLTIPDNFKDISTRNKEEEGFHLHHILSNIVLRDQERKTVK